MSSAYSSSAIEAATSGMGSTANAPKRVRCVRKSLAA
ncbi:Uncharacterised protein [Mycobacteroides abscessus subsp. abscessus]|nr:Uncharacterised protein [Mycobacteroides abscessus subsp. abscessus]